MLEILVWSVFVGSLGIEAVVAGGLLRWRQVVVGEQHQEEEEILTRYQTKDKLTTVETPPPASPPVPAAPATPNSGGNGRTEEKPSVTGGTGEEQVPVAPIRPQSNGAAAGAIQRYYRGDWEFKIVRASYDLFRDPAIFQRLCEEEAKAGWSLIEKLDDRRVRFKRPVALRDMLNPEALSFDPYRCHYGPSTNLVNLLGAIGALTAMLLPAYLGYALVSNTLAKSPNSQTAPPPVFTPSSPEPPTIP